MELTVASNDEKLVIIAHIVDNNIGIGGYYLLLGCQLGTLFELKIADSAGECEVAVDATKVDEATGGSNARLFACG